MLLAAKILTGLVLLIHVYIFLLETVLFRTRGKRVFGLTDEKVEIMAPAMSNQGCYNGFLAAALAIGLAMPSMVLVWYGLACVAIAGLWGAATVKKSILFIQTVPAVLAMAAWFLAR